MTKLRALCVYCASSSRGPKNHHDSAVRLGTLLAQRGVTLVYGGGMVGLMGACADSVLKSGGRVEGVIPRHLYDLEVGHRGIAKLHICDSMHERKQRMFELSDAFAILPGGLGTLDEAFEMITWRQLRLHDKPIVLVDVDGYWMPFRRLVRAVIDHGYATEDALRLFTVVERVDDVFDAIAKAPAPKIKPHEKWM